MAAESDFTNLDSSQSQTPSPEPTVPEDDELVQFDEAQARIAFSRAIAAGVLSEDPNAENSAFDYMFMGALEEGDAFKHFGTRRYVYHQPGGES